MQARKLLKGTALALVGWFALAPVNLVKAASPQPTFQVAQNEHYNGHLGPAWNNKKDHDEWYQGQRGRWYRGKDKDGSGAVTVATSGTKGSRAIGTRKIMAGNSAAMAWFAIIKDATAARAVIYRPMVRAW